MCAITTKKSTVSVPGYSSISATLSTQSPAVSLALMTPGRAKRARGQGASEQARWADVLTPQRAPGSHYKQVEPATRLEVNIYIYSSVDFLFEDMIKRNMKLIISDRT